jgi:glutamyl/glutaminyl-tRNA synthetase
MMDCKYIDDDLKTELAQLKKLRREQTSQLKNGSQKAFFTRVWERLQEIGEKVKAEDDDEVENVGRNEDEMEELRGCGSEEIRALLESKSTLSSMPSIEQCDSLVKTAMQQMSDEEINMSESAGDSITGGASKGSLNTVALNLSAMHCEDEKAVVAV